jgi:alanyl-tRNA synthetase
MRRAMRHAHLLGAREPLLWRLLPALVVEMGAAYPELVRAEPLIRETLKLEEGRFRETLERGLRLLDEEVGGLPSGGVLSGEAAFRLYDTYGFPIDLTQDALRERGLGVDLAGFDKAMARQRAEARAAWSGSGEQATEAVWLAIRERIGSTEFLGYDADEAGGQVQALVVDGHEVDVAEDGQDVALVANQTPFYAESGGQVGDTGTLAAEGGRLAVTDTQRRAGELYVHFGRVEGRIRVGDVLDMTVDAARRDATRANHSATHLLHKALRSVLGLHVTQKGSFVGPDRLRFDFSHPKAMSAEETEAVEGLVNAQVRRNAAVATRLMAPEAAIEAGALALFGEKYGAEVRVLSMGDAGGDQPYSVELCGGTHVRRTGDIALFKIIGEGAVAAGVRRIEALTGEAARLYLTRQEHAAREAAAYLKTTPDELLQRVVSMVEERRRLERELAEAKRKLATGGGGPAKSGPEVREVAGLKVAARVFEGLDPKDLRGLVDETKHQIGSGVVAFAAVKDGKAAIAVGVTDDLTSRYNAVDLVRRGASIVGGKGGGGRPDLAQAGGPDGAAAQAALDAITRSLEELAGAA